MGPTTSYMHDNLYYALHNAKGIANINLSNQQPNI